MSKHLLAFLLLLGLIGLGATVTSDEPRDRQVAPQTVSDAQGASETVLRVEQYIDQLFDDMLVNEFVEPYRPITVKHSEGAKINVVYWRNGRPMLVPEKNFTRGETQTTWGAPIGTYAVVQGNIGIVVIEGESDIRPDPNPDPKPIPDPGPSPEPEPEPEPEPAPEPVNYEGAFVIVVEETADREASVAKILGNEYWLQLRTRGLEYRFLDATTDKGKDYASLVDELPGIVIMTEPQEGEPSKMLFNGPLPESIESLDELVKKVTGR